MELKATTDFNSFNCTIPCIIPFDIEKYYSSIYTNVKFRDVQQEVLGMILSNCTFVSTECEISTFDVLDQITIEEHVKSVQYSNYYNEDEHNVRCMFVLFEMRGFLYRHAFALCRIKDINLLQQKFLLDRWRKDLKRRYILVNSSFDDCRSNAHVMRYERMVKRCLKLVISISQSEEHSIAMIHVLDDFEDKCVGLIVTS